MNTAQISNSISELEICYNFPNFSFLTFQTRNSNIKEKHLDNKFIFFSKPRLSNWV